MKILFIDNSINEYEKFQQLEFAREHVDQIAHVRSPVGIPQLVEANPDLRLIILDDSGYALGRGQL